MKCCREKGEQLATDVGLKSVGDYDQRLTSRAPKGKYACLEFGNTSNFRQERPVYIAKTKRFRETRNGIEEDNFRDRNGKNIEVEGKNRGKARREMRM